MFNKCQLHFQKTHLGLNYLNNCLSTKLQFGLGNLVSSELYFNVWFHCFYGTRVQIHQNLLFIQHGRYTGYYGVGKMQTSAIKILWIKDYLQVKIFCYLVVTPLPQPTPILVIVALIWMWLRIPNLKKKAPSGQLPGGLVKFTYIHQTTVLKCCWLPRILPQPSLFSNLLSRISKNLYAKMLQ